MENGYQEYVIYKVLFNVLYHYEFYDITTNGTIFIEK